MIVIINTLQIRFLMKGAFNIEWIPCIKSRNVLEEIYTCMKMDHTGNTDWTLNALMNMRNLEKTYALTNSKKSFRATKPSTEAFQNEYRTPFSSIEVTFIVQFSPEANHVTWHHD